jgi:cytidylate kinase
MSTDLSPPIVSTTAVLLGGPTGVGKSTVLSLLPERIKSCGVIDADDVWRVSSDVGVPETRNHAIRKSIDATLDYFDAGCTTAILGWVFARDELYQPVINAFEQAADRVLQIYLVADEATLVSRLNERNDLDRLEYSVSRLRLIDALPFHKIDTSDLAACDVADRVAQFIKQGPCT